MNVENTGEAQASRAGREKRLSRTIVLAVGVVVGMAVFVGLGRAVVRGQTVKSQPFAELRTQLAGGSQIGVTVRDVEEADVKREKLPAAAGAVVDEVRSDSPAAKAGIRAGDVIVTFDGERVRSARHVARLIEETPDGRQVEATVIRGGERISLKVAPVAAEDFAFGPLTQLKRFNVPERLTLNMPNRENLQRFRDFRGDLSRDLLQGRKLSLSPLGLFDRGRLGVGVQDLTGQLGEYFGTPDGVLVTAVDEGTPARTAGIKAGDVITKINGEAVRDSNDLRRRLADASGEMRVTLVRDRKEQTITVKIEDERVVSRERISR